MAARGGEAGTAAPVPGAARAARPAPQPLRVLFVVRGHGFGGAERQLVLLCRGLVARGVAVCVAAFYGGGRFAEAVAALPAVQLVDLGKRGRWDNVRTVRRLLRLARAWQPDVVHGYMGPANVAGLLAGALLHRPVVWAVRCTSVDFSSYDAGWRVSALVENGLARFVDLVIANSEAGRSDYERDGFPAARTVVIPNGIDTEAFRPAPEAGAAWRARHGIPAAAPLVGIVARLDPMKDHATFLAAAARVAALLPDCRFVCVGSGSEPYAGEVGARVAAAGLQDRCQLLPHEEDLLPAYNALDLLVSSSAFGEGFSNVLGEAMACGVPCVATRVGDSGRILGDERRLVPPRDAAALAQAMLAVLREPPAGRAALCAAVRERVVREYGLERMVESVLGQLTRLRARGRRGRPVAALG